MDGMQILRLWVPKLGLGCTSTARVFIGPGVRWCAVGTAPCIVSRLPKHHIRAVSWWIRRIAGFFAISLATARRLTDAECRDEVQDGHLYPCPAMIRRTSAERWPASKLIALTGRPGVGPGRRFTA
jgi:hypothetical protein